jgi:hypothetical protein
MRRKSAEGNRLIDNSTILRPTRNRLLIALGISACSVALLLASLGSLVNFTASILKTNIERREPLTIHIREEREENSNLATGIDTVRSLPQKQAVSTEVADIQEEATSDESPETPTDSQPVKDWRALAHEAAKASVDEYFRQKESRASMWRKTHSIMFERANEIVLKDKEPILSDIRFKRRSRVLGLGINVGSCFIGIPLAGVPVEERSVGITVFVCSQDSG